MHHHIVPDGFRRQHKKAVEIQVPFCRTASPSAFLVPDRNPAIGYAYLFCIQGSPGGKLLQRLIRQLPDIIHGQLCLFPTFFLSFRYFAEALSLIKRLIVASGIRQGARTITFASGVTSSVIVFRLLLRISIFMLRSSYLPGKWFCFL